MLIAAIDIWQVVVVPAVFFGLGILVHIGFTKNAAKGAASREVVHWQQALLHVIDVTKEIGRQNRNDAWDEPLVSKKVARVSDTLERILREHVGRRVARHISALRDVYEHVGELRELYSRALTPKVQRKILESAASLDIKVYDIRDALA